MRWLLNKNGVNTGEVFDDGVADAAPGDEGFTRDLVDAELAKRPANQKWTADFMGVSHAPPEPAPEPTE